MPQAAPLYDAVVAEFKHGYHDYRDAETDDAFSELPYPLFHYVRLGVLALMCMRHLDNATQEGT